MCYTSLQEQVAPKQATNQPNVCVCGGCGQRNWANDKITRAAGMPMGGGKLRDGARERVSDSGKVRVPGSKSLAMP